MATRGHRRTNRGAIAILTAVLMSVVLLVTAALAVDIGKQINRKHQLWITLDAAAEAGASKLPSTSTTAASTAAFAAATAHDPTETGTLAPTVDFFCMVASTGTSAPYSVDTTQMPATCYPGPGPYTTGSNYGTTGRKVTCNATRCVIPCVVPTPNTGTPKVSCNTIRVAQGRNVPFSFAPSFKISNGYTGSLSSVACRGPCGTIPPNPMDVAVVADRTASMAQADVTSMINGITGMLQQMTPSQQYVALGTIGRSVATTTSQNATCSSSSGAYPSSSVTSGSWLPVSFSNDYLSGTSLNSNSALVKQINCLKNQSSIPVGTALAAPAKAAARYLLGIDPNNLSSLPAQNAPQKVLILETDGEPNERIDTSTTTLTNNLGASQGSTNLTTSGDPYVSPLHHLTTPFQTTANASDTTSRSGSVTTVTHHTTYSFYYDGGDQACNNLKTVAANAKAAGIRVITIAYNMDANLKCNDWDGTYGDSCTNSSNCPKTSPPYPYFDGTNYTFPPNGTLNNGPETNTSTKKYKTEETDRWVKASTSASVLSVLAAAAGTATTSATADNNCSTSAEIQAENSDGDDFFCAASGTDMAPIFKTAISQAASGIKLVNLP